LVLLPTLYQWLERIGKPKGEEEGKAETPTESLFPAEIPAQPKAETVVFSEAAAPQRPTP
jgi:hypothetical protein